MRLLIALILLLMAVPVYAEQLLTFSCAPNTETDLQGYRVHYGTATGDYTQSVDFPNPQEIQDGRVIFAMPPIGDEYRYFAATAYDANNESDYSNEVAYDAPPAAPGAFRINVQVNVTVSTQ